MPISYTQEVYRKLIHLSSLWIVAAMYFGPWQWCAMVFAALCVGNAIIEYGHYRRWPVCHPLFEYFCGQMLRDNDSGKFKFSGGPPVLLSACLTVIIFPRDIACCAFAVMLIGDTAAALIGRRWGKHKLVNGKSAEGVIAFIIFSLPVAIFFGMVFGWGGIMYAQAVMGIILAAVAELFQRQLHLDDNLALPIIAGLAMRL